MEQKPFIVHLIRPAQGGMQNHVFELVCGLKKKGYSLGVISPKNESLRAKLRLIDVGLHEMPISDKLSMSDPLTVMRLARLLKHVKPDILHIHGNKTAVMGEIAASLAGISSTVVTIHNFQSYRKLSWPNKSVAGFIDRRLTGRADKIIAVSESLKSSLVDEGRFKPAGIAVIHNGIDSKKWSDKKASKSELRRRLGFGAKDFLAACIGRLIDWKGHEVLIEAAAHSIKAMPNLKVLIAGDGPLHDHLSALIKERGLDANVILLGYVADIKPLLALSDLFVFPSKREPFGLAVLEAMATGLPVIAADAGGIPEIITNGLNGVLVPPGNIAALSAAIEDLAVDARKRRAFAAGGRTTVADKFSLKRVIDLTELIYRESQNKSASAVTISAKI